VHLSNDFVVRNLANGKIIFVRSQEERIKGYKIFTFSCFNLTKIGSVNCFVKLYYSYRDNCKRVWKGDDSFMPDRKDGPSKKLVQ